MRGNHILLVFVFLIRIRRHGVSHVWNVKLNLMKMLNSAISDTFEATNTNFIKRDHNFPKHKECRTENLKYTDIYKKSFIRIYEQSLNLYVSS